VARTTSLNSVGTMKVVVNAVANNGTIQIPYRSMSF
jgi:hypothetical protein